MLHPKEEILYDVDDVEELSKDQLLARLKEYQKEGFVLQPENTKNPRYICVCCGCCCGVLQSVKKFPKPAEYYHSNYYAQVDAELCNGCETCVNRCQMGAIDMIQGKANVNLDRCIGCGNCVPTCGMKSLKLIKRKNQKIPPKNRNLLYQRIMTKKKGIIGTLGIVGKMLFGRKI
jgi:NAD-dependent dihydropyrimidine dehydrogenase PreA subunit